MSGQRHPASRVEQRNTLRHDALQPDRELVAPQEEKAAKESTPRESLTNG
jgi:hypothetical protein